VVTTTRGADGFDLGPRVPVAVADTADELAETAAGLLTDDEARESLGKRARAFAAEHFSPEAYARRFEQICADLQGQSSSE
jgi:glycosyltransferase involved in cell wall biosynthesis